MASGCSLFLDALRSLAHCCLVCVSDGQSAKNYKQCPLGTGLAPLAITLAKAGVAGGGTVTWKLSCRSREAEFSLASHKPHQNEPLQQGSAREAAEKETPQGGPGGREALLTTAAKGLLGPQAHAVQTRGANPTEPQSTSQ
ncbi:hypothetical protein NDU88_007277 [Pleurodeles waltl]|uniref:Uncharacterized protein n=1 Tax=Pleurodeles waltl TaxID=8319 RepID=A0AAV7RSH5_PLEWA|nr:hypothetical protein NDU88_007277 [Pleurodeles waltl]